MGMRLNKKQLTQLSGQMDNEQIYEVIVSLVKQNKTESWGHDRAAIEERGVKDGLTEEVPTCRTVWSLGKWNKCDGTHFTHLKGSLEALQNVAQVQ